MPYETLFAPLLVIAAGWRVGQKFSWGASIGGLSALALLSGFSGLMPAAGITSCLSALLLSPMLALELCGGDE